MKESKNSIFVAIIIILLILLVVSIVMIFKNNNIDKEEVSAKITNEITINEESNIIVENVLDNNKTTDNEKETSLKVETSTNSKITNVERERIQEYIDIICNRSKYYRLPEFNDVNQADKVWLYGHINREKYPNEATEVEIKKDLQDLFGNDLIVDVNKDIENNKNDTVDNMPFLYENNKYLLQSYGKDYLILYAINTIKKENDYYIVNVVEYSIQRDMENNPDEDYIICAYSEDSTNNWKKIFDKDNLKNNDITNKVLKQKKEFQNYNIKIIKNTDGNFNIKEIKNVKN